MNRCKKFLIANSLKCWSEASTTEFIEESKDEELLKVAKEHNIMIPSPNLSLFKTIYAKVDVPNLNGVLITREDTIKGLPTLVGAQINIDHTDIVCGYILKAELVNDFVVIYGTFLKNMFDEDKFENFKKLFGQKKLYVSFEIYNTDEKGNSVISVRKDGFRQISPIVFAGAGLLFNVTPACKEAVVGKIFASKQKNRKLDKNIIYA